MDEEMDEREREATACLLHPTPYSWLENPEVWLRDADSLALRAFPAGQTQLRSWVLDYPTTNPKPGTLSA